MKITSIKEPDMPIYEIWENGIADMSMDKDSEVIIITYLDGEEVHVHNFTSIGYMPENLYYEKYDSQIKEHEYKLIRDELLRKYAEALITEYDNSHSKKRRTVYEGYCYTSTKREVFKIDDKDFDVSEVIYTHHRHVDMDTFIDVVANHVINFKKKENGDINI